MFRNHPKGLYILALANTGERFGYYTVVSVLLFYLQSKFGFSNVAATQLIGGFMAFVYLMPLFGGWLADRWSFSKCVSLGLIVMGAGYLVISLPTAVRSTQALTVMVVGMVLVGLGTGLFKSNLQVMIGDLYNAPEFAGQRDAAFSIFYMAINLGAMFAPSMASLMNKLALDHAHFAYNGQLANYCNVYLNGDTSVAEPIMQIASEYGMNAADVAQFAADYTTALSTGYGYSFAVAFVSVVVSYGIYLFGRGTYRHIVTAKKSAQTKAQAAEAEADVLTSEQTRSRIKALFFVFGVVIFFWMVFMQNSATLTKFAEVCTEPNPGGWTRIGFNIWALLLVAVGVYAGFEVVQSRRRRPRFIAAAVLCAVVAYIIYYYMTTPNPLTDVQPQDYQQFNGFFIVALTPFSLAFFGWLARRGHEPSAPRKIGYGMIVAAVAYAVMTIGSVGIVGTTASVSSNWLISTYFLLTIAELLLSPMGISFVSKVAPPKYKGAMMGCWFVSTAIGNYLIFIPMLLWGKAPVWAVWTILMSLCLLSAAVIFSMMKKLEAVTR